MHTYILAYVGPFCRLAGSLASLEPRTVHLCARVGAELLSTALVITSLACGGWGVWLSWCSEVSAFVTSKTRLLCCYFFCFVFWLATPSPSLRAKLPPARSLSVLFKFLCPGLSALLGVPEAVSSQVYNQRVRPAMLRVRLK